MYASVVVLTYQSGEIQTYTYEIPKELQKEIRIGQLVEIPFGKRIPRGIIIATSDQQPVTRIIKPITSILFPIPLLLPYQIELLKWMSFYYHAPMVNCAEAMLPPIPKRALRYNAPMTSKVLATNQKHDGVSLKNTAESQLRRGAGGVLSEAGQPIRFNKDSGRAFFDGGKDATSQTIVLVSNINRIPETMARFPASQNFAIYHSELPASQKFATWLKIASGQRDFIFGSRSAIFVPCSNLSKIIIFDEHHSSYKDERSPYFDTLTVAQEINQFTGAKIEIVDSAPKTTTYHLLKSQVKIPRLTVKTHLVSMLNERKKGNFSPISDLLKAALSTIIYKQHSKALLFLNKKRESGQLFCNLCHTHLFLKSPPATCPNCQSPNIHFNILNVTTLAASIKKIFPAAHINIIAEKTQQPATSGHQPVFDIATASIFFSLTPKKYDLIAAIATDSKLNIADFDSAEKTYSQIIDLKKLLLRNGQLILQTFKPEHQVLNFAAKNNYFAFYNFELFQRQTYAFPPFALLVKLTIKGKNQEKTFQKANNLVEKMEDISNQLPVTNNQRLIEILGPYQSIFTQRIPSYNIILKTKLNAFSLLEREKALEQLNHLLKSVPRDWQITVEPENIN